MTGKARQIQDIFGAPDSIHFITLPEVDHLQLSPPTFARILADIQHVARVKLARIVPHGGSGFDDMHESEVHKLAQQPLALRLTVALHEKAVHFVSEAEVL